MTLKVVCHRGSTPTHAQSSTHLCEALAIFSDRITAIKAPASKVPHPHMRKEERTHLCRAFAILSHRRPAIKAPASKVPHPHMRREEQTHLCGALAILSHRGPAIKAPASKAPHPHMRRGTNAPVRSVCHPQSQRSSHQAKCGPSMTRH